MLNGIIEWKMIRFMASKSNTENLTKYTKVNQSKQVQIRTTAVDIYLK
jgi:hypothetical protein